MSFCARQIQRRMNPSRSHSYSGKSKALFLQFLCQQYYIVHHALEMFRRIKIKFTKKQHMIIIITLKMCAHIAYEYEVASNWNCARMKKIVVVYALFMDARVLPHSSTWARHISYSGVTVKKYISTKEEDKKIEWSKYIVQCNIVCVCVKKPQIPVVVIVAGAVVLRSIFKWVKSLSLLSWYLRPK